jgi:hypothetical protein
MNARMSAIASPRRYQGLGDAEARQDLARFAALDPLDDFPLVEVRAREHLHYLKDPADFAAVMQRRDIGAANRWLAARGIDLIVALCPIASEVYSEHFFSPCPPDGIVAPHVRRALLDLLESDVEVVDALPMFRAALQPDPDYLYYATDPHWGPRGRRLAVQEVAKRLQRYEFGRNARSGPPVVRVGPYIPTPERELYGWDSLLAPQRQRTAKAPPPMVREVTMTDGSVYANDPASPLALIGSSFANQFDQDLAVEANIRPRRYPFSGQTTEAFEDFLREPERLEGVRVVLWVIGEWQLAYLKPLPAPILAERR